uniref:Uncharacterized protein n=1 Tax=Rhizophora mucronata TaxID=61149 RepID=A0A2P2P3B7_RHIMU
MYDVYFHLEMQTTLAEHTGYISFYNYSGCPRHQFLTTFSLRTPFSTSLLH